MMIKSLLLISFFSFFYFYVNSAEESEETELYYYGIEESERGLASCGAGAACAALLRRYWRPRALLRLCRCGRRRRCDTPAPADHHIQLNNRATLQFCKPITDWPECKITDVPLTVASTLERMNPDEIESLHHRNIQLAPPTVTVTCRCRQPFYWKLHAANDTHHSYRCASLPPCQSGEFCGNVSDDLQSLYQSCLCPANHMCVHDGGISHVQISELLYSGRGWRAFCRPISESYEDY
ncbi:uncharacterized protein LOC121739205 [Aricia agestis]|uniref:uncharacterized protein LOC121739205 n=1 Tax=Aricia agestis TaxID=91739 RepID=UPI001C206835|nr:uncharacterized protein LOC121739205 [Aricia agestis]